jgi:hypoxanthine phosphoribosyltransferase
VLLPSDAARADRGVSHPEAAVGTLLDRGELASIARRLGAEIARDYPDGVVLVALLKGSVCFLADLVRELPGPCELDFLVLSAYGDGQTRVRVTKDLDLDVTGRDVVVVMDLVDTGLTLGYVLRLIALRRARSTAACALLDRQSRRLLPVDIRYVGRVIGDEYVVGYGLDFDERYRNLPGLEVADEAELRAEPDAMFDRLSRR